jgi:hypothetical protein
MYGLASMMGVQASSFDLPSGTIAMWHGLLANIPSGWNLCDGTSSTPDMRNCFLRGAAVDANPGGTGGSATHIHSDHSVQSHTGAAVSNHPALSHSGGNATHGLNGGQGVQGVPTTYMITQTTHTVTQASDHASRSHSVTQPSNHAVETHNSMNFEPNYYTVAFIRKI